MRAIAGLWPWGGGSIEVKKGAKMFLLPQRPYVPIGTLRRAATYPDAPESRSVEEVADAFKHVGLEHLDGQARRGRAVGPDPLRRREAAPGVCAHLAAQPRHLVLDEATAALDPKSQVKLMELLVDRGDITLLSVGHRPELEAFHTRKIELERRSGGAKLVRDVELIEPTPRMLWRRLRQLVRGQRKNGVAVPP